MSVKQFNVYKHPTIGLQAVKQGFCWPAFLFTWIWLFVCKMWANGSLVLIAFTISSMIGPYFGFGLDGSIGTLLVQLLLCLFVGGNGNKWRESTLIDRGFVLVKKIDAQTSDSAIGKIASEK